MRSIKTKIITVVVVCAVLSSLICGAISMIKSGKMVNEDSQERLENVCTNYGKDIDRVLSNIELSVNTLASMTTKSISDLDSFQSSSSYVEKCTDKVKDIALEAANNTEGVMTYYIRYNPEFTEATSGIFASKETAEAEFKQQTPTDFSMYKEDDLEHVGWYYIPVKNGKPTWMDPYLNSNINVYMISYVVPLVIDGTSVGIVGMDIDFSQLQTIANQAKSYDTGYGFLVNTENKIMTHLEQEVGTDLSKCNEQLAQFVAGTDSDGVVDYTYQGTKKTAGFYTLKNGMKLIETAPDDEIRQESMEILKMILIAALVAMLFSAIIGFIVSIRLTRPIKNLTNIISQTACLNFEKDKNSEKLVRMKDETGNMARAVQQMRSKLREMVALIDQAGIVMEDNVISLDSNMDDVETICSANSATTEELAAAMEEAASATETVNEAIQNVNENARNIEELSVRGLKNSVEIKERANEMTHTTEVAS